MTDSGPHFQDTILRVLETAPRGLTVERIRSQLANGGAVASKDEIVRALVQMNERQLVQLGATRRWLVRHHSPRTGRVGQAGSSISEEYLVSIPCQAAAGEEPVTGPEMPMGRIEPNIDLLRQLLPYYQESLRAGDSGSPQAFANQYGDSFGLLEPDKPWWPTAERGRTLIVPLPKLPDGLRSLSGETAQSAPALGLPTTHGGSAQRG